MKGHQYQWLAVWLWPWNRKFLEVASMVVSWWIVLISPVTLQRMQLLFCRSDNKPAVMNAQVVNQTGFVKGLVKCECQVLHHNCCNILYFKPEPVGATHVTPNKWQWTHLTSNPFWGNKMLISCLNCLIQKKKMWKRHYQCWSCYYNKNNCILC